MTSSRSVNAYGLPYLAIRYSEHRASYLDRHQHGHFTVLRFPQNPCPLISIPDRSTSKRVLIARKSHQGWIGETSSYQRKLLAVKHPIRKVSPSPTARQSPRVPGYYYQSFIQFLFYFPRYVAPANRVFILGRASRLGSSQSWVNSGSYLAPKDII